MTYRSIVGVGLTMAGTLAGSAHAQTMASPHGPITSTDCQACHVATSWTQLRNPVAFDHDRETAFPLEARHRAVPCTGCHLNLRFADPAPPTDCASCHLDVHRGNLGTACIQCHRPTSFADIQGLAIHAGTSFPLTGTHLQVSCETCHMDDRGGAFTPVAADCLACHRSDYRETSAGIDHVAAAFPTNCEQCHTTLTWTGGVAFDHPAASAGYPLIEAHALAPCADCHDFQTSSIRWAPAGPDDCVACHQADYNSEHGGSGYPTECATCHTQTNWDATFDHIRASNGYPLVEAHAQAPCASCHDPQTAAVRWTPSGPDDCIACHQADYNTEHAGTGFPTTCLTCHNQTNWNASFTDHDDQFFPIFAGAHREKWDDCTTCHINPSSYQVFSCLNCHEHNKTSMDEKHREESGYAYDSQRCYNCHPRGSED